MFHGQTAKEKRRLIFCIYSNMQIISFSGAKLGYFMKNVNYNCLQWINPSHAHISQQWHYISGQYDLRTSNKCFTFGCYTKCKQTNSRILPGILPWKHLVNHNVSPELNDETEPRPQMGFHSQALTATVRNSSCETQIWYLQSPLTSWQTLKNEVISDKKVNISPLFRAKMNIIYKKMKN